MREREATSETILVLAPVGRDAELAAESLKRAGFHAQVCKHLAELVENLARPCGAALVAEESLYSPGMADLTKAMKQQPAWSDLPVIILTSGRSASEKSRALMDLFAPQGNITLLERPLRVITLCSVLDVALRARRRQYEVRELLREREEVLSSERAARNEAEKASRMKDEFLATLSHELRTPLNAILGWSCILQATLGDEEELLQGLQTIERNARSQSKIIEDLLDMSRIISGKIQLASDSVEMGELIRAAVETVAPAAAGRGITIQVEIDPKLGDICGDSNRLQQILFNLLTNAIKFTAQGGRVEIHAERLESSMEISIKDTGIGISPKFLTLVFDRFRQADASSTRQHGGLGLGLAIVKQLVELHGGTVRAESAGVGEGSDFTISLPLGRTAQKSSTLPVVDPADSAFADTPEWKSGDRLSGVRILVVDDEADARSMMKRLLEQSGAIVQTAASALEAFAHFQEKPPEVLISDIGMPGENGYSLIRRVRALDPAHGGRVPAVAVTAYARSQDRYQALRAGFHTHAVKPIEPAELIELVTRLVPRHREESLPL